MPAVTEIYRDKGNIWIPAANSINTSLYCKVENSDAFLPAELLKATLLLHCASLSSLTMLRECLFAVLAHQEQPCLFVHLIYTSVAMSSWQRLFWKLGTRGTRQFLRVWSSELRADIHCVLLGGQELTGLDEFWASISFSALQKGIFFCISVLGMPEFFRQFNAGKIYFVISLICFAVSPTRISLTAFWNMDRNSDIQSMHCDCCSLGMHQDSCCPFPTFLQLTCFYEISDETFFQKDSYLCSLC